MYVSLSSPPQTFADKCCEREVLSLGVRCDNYLNGCLWSGALRDLMVGASFQIMTFACHLLEFLFGLKNIATSADVSVEIVYSIRRSSCFLPTDLTLD